MQDITLKDDYQLQIKNGDFVVEDSTRQHQELLLLSYKGQYREFPALGVGMHTYLLEDGDPEAFKLEVIKQFELDGMQVDAIEMEPDGKVFIDARYE